MAEIISLQTQIDKRGSRSRDRAGVGSAQILIFDGVRYEPMLEDEADFNTAYPVQRHGAGRKIRINREA